MTSAVRAYETFVERIRDETPSVKSFRLRLERGSAFAFLPGQFVMVHFPDDPKLSRAYSIASSPAEEGVVEIAMSKVGAFTSRLFALREGDRLNLKGPYGKWVYRGDAPHAVLVSGGTGITPFRCIARTVIDRRLPNRITLLYSSKTPSEILYRSELEAWAKLPNFEIIQTITRPRLLRPGEVWKGAVGRINVAMIEKAVPDMFDATYYVCGPNPLVEEISAGLRAKGIPAKRIRYEKWGDY